MMAFDIQVLFDFCGNIMALTSANELYAVDCWTTVCVVECSRLHYLTYGMPYGLSCRVQVFVVSLCLLFVILGHSARLVKCSLLLEME